MDSLSQLDIANPDHVSVITRNGKITISVTKDGTSVTLGIPVKAAWLNSTPMPPHQQPAPQDMAVKDTGKIAVLTKKTRISPPGNTKLDASKVRSIKQLLADEQVMNAFRSRQQAYEMIGSKFNVSYHTINNIHKGLAWRHVSI